MICKELHWEHSITVEQEGLLYCMSQVQYCVSGQVRQHPKLLRQVLALDRLVGATVKALSTSG
jgi:hypothetical protein